MFMLRSSLAWFYEETFRWGLIQRKPIKQICRELRVSRNTVRKVVRSGATEFSYDRTSQPRPKIDPWRSDLDEMLAENDRQPKRQRLTLVRIYEELRNRGYDGSYDAVRRYAASWSKATREASAAAYVPLSFDPGEAYQFDWSHEVVLIDGVTTTVKVAHVRLGHSRMPFVQAYPRETQEMVFDAHDNPHMCLQQSLIDYSSTLLGEIKHLPLLEYQSALHSFWGALS